jgi:hypothetical protein
MNLFAIALFLCQSPASQPASTPAAQEVATHPAPPAGPSLDQRRFEAERLRRIYYQAVATMDAQTKELQKNVDEAANAANAAITPLKLECDKANKIFDGDRLTCAEKPAAAPPVPAKPTQPVPPAK